MRHDGQGRTPDPVLTRSAEVRDAAPAHERPPARRAGRRGGRRVASLLLLLGIAVPALAALVAWEALALRDDAIAAERALRAARVMLDEATAGGSDFRFTGAQLRAARAHLDHGRARVESAQRRAVRLRPALWLARRLPRVPAGTEQIAPLLETSRLLAISGQQITDGLAPLVREVDGDGDSSLPAGTRLAAAFAAGEPHIRAALATLDEAHAARGRVDGDRLAGPLTRVRPGLEEFDAAWPRLRRDLAELAELAPAVQAVLGMDRPKTYAILGQNSSEIRPTGGFISSLGLITLDHGQVTRQEYRSSYSFDNPAMPVPLAPLPMARYLGADGWALRDANWSPHFPTTAKVVEGFLGYNAGISVDGVIAFDTFAVGEILRVLGPVAVPDFPEPVTAEQWYALATQLIHGDPSDTFEEVQASKGRVLGPILGAVAERLQAVRAGELPEVLRALRRAVDERHLLVAFRDPGPAALARRHGADGRLPPPTGADTLYVVDANLSYSKVGPYLRQSITYEVTVSARGVATESRLSVTYHNGVTPDVYRQFSGLDRIGGGEWDPVGRVVTPLPGLFGSWTRVYVPRGTRFFAADAPLLLEEEAGLLSAGRYVRVPGGGSAAIEYRYQVPVDLTPRGTYRLRVIKQPGTRGHELEVRIRLPTAATVRAAAPDLIREGDALVYRGQLTRNREFWLELE